MEEQVKAYLERMQEVRGSRLSVVYDVLVRQNQTRGMRDVRANGTAPRAPRRPRQKSQQLTFN